MDISFNVYEELQKKSAKDARNKIFKNDLSWNEPNFTYVTETQYDKLITHILTPEMNGLLIEENPEYLEFIHNVKSSDLFEYWEKKHATSDIILYYKNETLGLDSSFNLLQYEKLPDESSETYKLRKLKLIIYKHRLLKRIFIKQKEEIENEEIENEDKKYLETIEESIKEIDGVIESTIAKINTFATSTSVQQEYLTKMTGKNTLKEQLATIADIYFDNVCANGELCSSQTMSDPQKKEIIQKLIEGLEAPSFVAQVQMQDNVAPLERGQFTNEQNRQLLVNVLRKYNTEASAFSGILDGIIRKFFPDTMESDTYSFSPSYPITKKTKIEMISSSSEINDGKTLGDVRVEVTDSFRSPGDNVLYTIQNVEDLFSMFYNKKISFTPSPPKPFEKGDVLDFYDGVSWHPVKVTGLQNGIFTVEYEENKPVAFTVDDKNIRKINPTDDFNIMNTKVEVFDEKDKTWHTATVTNNSSSTSSTPYTVIYPIKTATVSDSKRLRHRTKNVFASVEMETNIPRTLTKN